MSKKEIIINSLEELENVKFGTDFSVAMKTSTAWNGEARSNGEANDITVNVLLGGVNARDILEGNLSTGKVLYQRTRRAKASGGSFETIEEYNAWAESKGGNGGEDTVHYSNLGHAPDKIKTVDDLVSESDQALAGKTPEEIQDYIAKLQERYGG